jgi:hypothetical protein
MDRMIIERQHSPPVDKPFQFRLRQLFFVIAIVSGVLGAMSLLLRSHSQALRDARAAAESRE